MLKWDDKTNHNWLTENVHNSAWCIGYIQLNKQNEQAFKLLGAPVTKFNWFRFTRYIDAVNFLFAQSDFG